MTGQIYISVTIDGIMMGKKRFAKFDNGYDFIFPMTDRKPPMKIRKNVIAIITFIRIVLSQFFARLNFGLRRNSGTETSGFAIIQLMRTGQIGVIMLNGQTSITAISNFL